MNLREICCKDVKLNKLAQDKTSDRVLFLIIDLLMVVVNIRMVQRIVSM